MKELPIGINFTNHAQARLQERFGVKDYVNWLTNNRKRFRYSCRSTNNTEVWLSDDQFIELIYSSKNNSVVSVFPHELRQELDENAVAKIRPVINKINQANLREYSQKVSELYERASQIASLLSRSFDPKYIKQHLSELLEVEGQITEERERRQAFKESLDLMLREEI